MKLVNHKLSMLLLDTKNYRTGPSNNQAEAIAKIVQLQKEKITEMASDIISNGMSPFDITAVSPADEHGFRIVYEGNRRIAALKLLENPNLAGNDLIAGRFERLRPEYLKKPIREITCSEVSDRQTAMLWVDRKQGTNQGGRGTETWGFVANARRRADEGNYDRWLAIVDLLRASGDPMEGIEYQLTEFRIGATIERVLKSPDLSKILGIDFFPDGKIEFENGDSDKGRKLIKAILTDLVDMKPGTNAFYSNEQISAYLIKYNILSVKTADQSHPKRDDSSGNQAGGSKSESNAHPSGRNNQSSGISTTEGEPTGTTPKSARDKSESTNSRVRSPQSQRKTLAPTAPRLKLDIENERLHELYVSLRKLDVEKKTFVCSVMIRVFLDLTLTYFLIETQHPLPAASTARGGMSWLHKSLSLKEKLSAAVSVADPTAQSQTFKPARDGLNPLYPHSIYALHDSLHQIDQPVPTKEAVISAWDAYHPLFQNLYELLKTK